MNQNIWYTFAKSKTGIDGKEFSNSRVTCKGENN